ncbi:MAG: DUF4373 domain-containing protein [Alkalibacterium sp.]|nr:DUF4373 domain-containing protein [Alkalibacterium sp.]
MARPRKTGIDYFPFDVDFLSDIKIRKILRGCGEGAVGILISVLSNIYRDEGYFILVDDDFYFFIADELGITEDQVSKVIKKGVEVELFNKKMFDTYNILTSSGIQKRYMKATEKRKNVEIEKTYCIVTEKNISSHINLVNEVVKVEETRLSEEETPVNDGRSTQSIVQDSTGQESKVATTDGGDNLPEKFNALSSFEQLWAFPNFVQNEDLNHLIDQYDDDLVTAAVKLAGSKDVKKGQALSFIESALREWADNNVKTVDQAREYQKNRNKQFKPKQNNWKSNKSNNKSESLPDWAENPDETDEKVSPEEEQAFKDRMARIRAKKGAVE